MQAESDALIANDISAYLDKHEHKSLLRFITCGSVDDGKSTLIGRLLYESKTLFEDQLDTVTNDSKKWGTQGKNIDFALLVDGLAAEREQGITIDVAYRFFSTDSRKFIVADTPGHEQYTRNMVTGASTADVAVILVDARAGLLTQTRRHSYLVSLLGIRNVVLAVNKMDLMDYDESVFTSITEDYMKFAKSLNIENITAIPMSALAGDNITEPSNNMSWYHGTTLLSWLETVKIDNERRQEEAFRMPVQWVNRPSLDFRGYAGTITGGRVAPGDAIRIQPSGRMSQVARIVTFDGDLDEAVTGQSVTLTLTDEVDASRGDVISAGEAPASVADQFETTIVWMHDEPLLAGRPYLLKMGTKTVNATVTTIKHQVNVNTLEESAATQLELNAIGVCNISTDQPLAFDSYKTNREMGGFILIDRMNNATVGAGMLHFSLRRADNIHLQATDVDKKVRSAQKSQKPAIVWFTGLSGAGKSTIANLVEKQLLAKGHHTYLLDGDNVRHGLNRDLGFTDADRVENIRRIGEVASLMVDSGLIVLTAFISPFRSERALARSLVEEGEFIEVHVDTPLSIAEDRDPKGLYKKARRGELSNFTGIDSPYEAPEQPEIMVDTSAMSAEQAAERVVAELRRRGVLNPPE
ncbi:sulfate adenylyltransferase subunit CysN [Granulosicoccus antarcticus]|uniref:Multifunctional fusion protein n=1 Tax=Granulosicoccus antarcticus IMCC3135 TaxID=1192854 RepID=A0A2Z2NNP0_9GAMM|nr:sulfate adenylyltransferase subunit CysN [Granulosicoccus antarcticus]ASJ72145.1 Bifunctional enzyme CysN/CysC [Granulosicoccus antarcticus IMCC3135]